MSSILSSKDAFLKQAVYEDDGKRRVFPRAERPPAPTQEDQLIAVLAEIRSAVQLNARLIERLPSNENKSDFIADFSTHIQENQKIMLRLLSEIKRANTAQENKEPSKWKSTIVRDRHGEMVDIIHVEIKG